MLAARLCAGLTVLAVLPPLAAAQATTILLTGSSTVYPLMVDIARRFEAANPGVSIEVHSGGSAKGIADLRAGISDIGMVSRQLAENERDLFAFPLCRDGAAIVVHRSNPLAGLRARQLAEVLTGAVTDWKQLGGKPGPIRLAWRAEGQAIPELVLNQLKLRPEQVRSKKTIFENADAIAFVANDRKAITLAALGVAVRSLKSGSPIKLLAYEGVPASTRSVRDHTYALARPLALVTRSQPSGMTKRLIEYAGSRAVTDLQEQHGFVPYQD